MFNKVPQQLFIDHDGWKRYWEEYDKAAVDSRDAYTVKWWQELNIPAAPVVDKIDQLLPRADWGSEHNFSWKGDEDDKEDNDCSIHTHSKNYSIKEFQFRTDLRNAEKAGTFLSAMLRICSAEEMLVMDNQGKLMKPSPADVMPSLEKSSAVRFLMNPKAFIEQALRNL
ncbi:hypothetical protein [Hymenobacter translucens]|uniref:hypothetical protein n=1 Tax=Hymenobacter translucens TaxID=2886507 RepID=UPI001D0E3068|nr:hypothetical protein [Hymenobacter translucens]